MQVNQVKIQQTGFKPFTSNRSLKQKNPCVKTYKSQGRGKNNLKVNIAYKEKVQNKDSIQQQEIEQIQEQQFKFDWQKQWYIIGFDSYLDKSKIHTVTLLEKPLVYWWDTVNERWSVMLDQCPHKLVPLSEGKITKDAKIQCGYHGWEFSSCGKCEKITFGDEGVKIGKRQSGTAFPCYTSYNMLWVYAQPFEPNMEPLSKTEYESKVSEWREENKQDMKYFIGEKEGWKGVVDISRDLPYDYVTFCDNLLDLTHVHYTHFNSLVKKINDVPITQVLTENNSPLMMEAQTIRPDGFRSQTNFRYPCMNFICSPDTGQPIRVAMEAQCIPMEPGKCRALFSTYIQIRSQDWKFKLARFMTQLRPKWYGHVMLQNVVLDDDLYFLHKGERLLSKKLIDSGNPQTQLGQLYSMPHKTDVTVNEFRKWLNKYAGGGPFGPMDENWLQKVGPVQSFEQAYERYHSHTKNCLICSNALKNIQKLKKAFSVASLVSGLASVLSLSFSLIQGHFHIFYWTKQLAFTQEQSLFQNLSAVILNGFKTVIVGNGYQGTLAKCLGLAVLSTICFVAYRKLQNFEKLFYKGYDPYPRNQEQ